MSKLIGALLIIGTSTLTGAIIAERLLERSRLLRVLLRLLNVLKTEIGFHSRLLGDVFHKAAQVVNHRDMTISLEKIAKNIGFGSDYDLAELWEGFINENEMSALLTEDKVILKELGVYLGSTDREDQTARIETARIRLESNLEIADFNIARRVKLYRYFGFAAGAVLVCMLL